MRTGGLVALGLLSGCALLQPEPVGTALARETARSAVAPVVAKLAPGTPVDRAVDCVMSYASRGQVEALAQNSALGQPELNDDIVTDIIYTDGTRACPRGNPLHWLLF